MKSLTSALVLLLALIISAQAAATARTTYFPVPQGARPHDVAATPQAAGPVYYTAQATGRLGILDPASGKVAIAKYGCGGCHTFEAAGSTGTVGPNLDDQAPAFETVVSMVTNGGGPMPAFGDQLSEQEIRDVAAFVSGS